MTFFAARIAYVQAILCIEPFKIIQSHGHFRCHAEAAQAFSSCRALLLCAASLGQLFFDVLHQLSIVLGVVWYGQGQVAQRFSGTGQPTRGEPDADGKAKARRLTSGIKKVHSAEKLIEVLDRTVDGPIFNFFHASAAYTQLVTLKRRKGLQQREWDSPVLLRLHARVEDMVLEEQVGARETANIFWSIAQLSGRLSIPTQLLAALVKSVPTKVKGMDEQNLSNTLWACAKLKEVAPGVLEAVPAIVAQIPIIATDMVQQALSNCLWAVGQLKDEAPEVLEAVPAIVMQIPKKAQKMVPQDLSNNLLACAQLNDDVPEVLDMLPAIVGEIPAKLQGMKPQEMSNSLEALVLLRDSVPEVGGVDDILSSAAERLNTLLPKLRGKDLSFTVPVVVWACAKAEVYHGELLGAVARCLGSRTKLSALPDFGVCALSWSYQVLDSDDDFEDFKALLMSETEKRGFSEADVQSCQHGRSG